MRLQRSFCNSENRIGSELLQVSEVSHKSWSLTIRLVIKRLPIIYSITETAKANNLNPFRYLDYVLTVLKDHQDDTDYSFIEELLPWSDQLPEICRSKSKTTNM